MPISYGTVADVLAGMDSEQYNEELGRFFMGTSPLLGVVFKRLVKAETTIAQCTKELMSRSSEMDPLVQIFPCLVGETPEIRTRFLVIIAYLNWRSLTRTMSNRAEYTQYGKRCYWRYNNKVFKHNLISDDVEAINTMIAAHIMLDVGLSTTWTRWLEGRIALWFRNRISESSLMAAVGWMVKAVESDVPLNNVVVVEVEYEYQSWGDDNVKFIGTLVNAPPEPANNVLDPYFGPSISDMRPTHDRNVWHVKTRFMASQTYVDFPLNLCMNYYENWCRGKGLEVLDHVTKRNLVRCYEEQWTGAKMMDLALNRQPQVPVSNVPVPGLSRVKEGWYPMPEIPKLKASFVPHMSQVVTWEFIRERELVPFMSTMGYDVGPYYASPYLPTVFVEKKAEQNMNMSYRGGVIADGTGTGKTIKMIVACMMVPGQHSLIFVPDELVLHWSSEIEKHTELTVAEDPQFRNLENGQVKKRKVEKVSSKSKDVVVLHRTQCLRRFVWRGAPQIILVSHSAARSKLFEEKVSKYKYDRMIVEEAHKSTSTKLMEIMVGIKRESTWLVSATPYTGTKNIQRLLGFSELMMVLYGIWNDRISRSLEVMMYQLCTTRCVIQETDLKVNVTEVICEWSEQEKVFMNEIIKIMTTGIRSGATFYTLNRFFRLMERLGAGGVVDQELILHIIRNLFGLNQNQPHRHQNRVLEAELNPHQPQQTKDMGFAVSTDDCCICICPFSNPVQLTCGHILCRGCLISILQVQRKACPFCQKDLKGPVYVPNFQDKPVEAKEEPEVKEPELPQKRKIEGPVTAHMYKQTLAGVGNKEDPNFLHMTGKMDAFTRDLRAWKASAPEDEQIVIFAKEMEPATYFHRIIENEGLSVLCAGLMGVRKVQSITNIEKFRQGEARILFISTKYSSGFDLYMARRLWIINTDLDPAVMAQSKGRVTRLVQKYNEVDIRVFMYPGGFDQFLWDTREQLNLKKTGFKREHVYCYYLYLVYALGTSAGAINMRNQIPKLKFDSFQASQVSFNESWYFSFWDRQVYGPRVTDAFVV